MEPSNETKLKIATIERDLWANTLYQNELRYRLHAKMKSEASVLKSYEDEMVKCQQFLDAVEEEIKALASEGA